MFTLFLITVYFSVLQLPDLKLCSGNGSLICKVKKTHDQNSHGYFFLTLNL